jgi:Mrp family chromosome partitioning ATPase
VLGEPFDRIIIDSPPVMSATEARIIAATADATLLVLRMNRSQRKLCTTAVEELRRVGAKIVGAVVNDVPAGEDYPYVGVSRYHAVASRLPLMSAAGGLSDAPRAGSRGLIVDAKRDAREARQNELPAEILAIEEPDWTSVNG